MLDLCTVVPVYNERDSLPGVLDEWLRQLRQAQIEFKILLVDGGSTDGSVELVREYQRNNSEVLLEVREDLRYGPSCMLGYQTGIELGAEWLLQIDSDGQCDPSYFPEFWRVKRPDRAVQGLRVKREDGYSRLVVSRLLSLMIFCLTGKYVADLNVPYRLMHRNTIADLLPLVPADFSLANILLSYLYDRLYGIEWVPIVFRMRTAGNTTWNFRKMVEAGFSITGVFLSTSKKLRNRRPAP